MMKWRKIEWVKMRKKIRPFFHRIFVLNIIDILSLILLYKKVKLPRKYKMMKWRKMSKNMEKSDFL